MVHDPEKFQTFRRRRCGFTALREGDQQVVRMSAATCDIAGREIFNCPTIGPGFHPGYFAQAMHFFAQLNPLSVARVATALGSR
jgi:hypothetical protein